MSSTANSRLNNIIGQIQPNSTGSSSVKSSTDVVIVSALRTPITKARKGGLKDTYVEDLLATVLKAVLDQTKIKPAEIGDIIVGTVLGQGSQRANECRIAGFLAGIPESVPIHTINRQCSSGLQAIAHAAANIKAGKLITLCKIVHRACQYST
jgi:acetyl-CoA acetyltransferase